MPKFVYTPDMVTWLKQNAPGRGTYQLTDMFNLEFGKDKTRTSIRSALKNHGIKSGFKGNDSPNKRTLMTPEQADWLRQAYKGRSRKEVTKLFNDHFGASITYHQIVGFTKRYGMKSGRTGHLKKAVFPQTKEPRG